MRLFVAVLFVLIGASVQAESTLSALTALMQENLDACTVEDMPRLMATMSVEMPQRELFEEQTRAEWESSNLYHKLDEIKIVRWRQVSAPYLVAVVTQTISPNAAFQAEEPEGDEPDEDLSHTFSLRTRTPQTRSTMLFKKERGKWKIVAGLDEPVPVEDCPDGNCRWPRQN